MKTITHRFLLLLVSFCLVQACSSTAHRSSAANEPELFSNTASSQHLSNTQALQDCLEWLDINPAESTCVKQ